jgi:peptidoglycan/xylan/chitin deacetylase (PgdA/CDA1 family)
MEIANHGWQHEDFRTFSESAQENLMSQCNTQIGATLGANIQVKTFVPPFNNFNADTITASLNQGFTHFSSQVDLDPGPFNYDSPVQWRFPIGASTNDRAVRTFFKPVSHASTWNEVLAQRARYGYAVVMMHPMEFSYGYNNGTYENRVNQTMITELVNLLTLVKQSGLRVVLLGNIEKYFNNTYTDSCYTTTGTLSGSSTQTATTSGTRTITSTSASPTTSSGQTNVATSGTSSSVATTSEDTSYGVRIEMILALLAFSIFLCML